MIQAILKTPKEFTLSNRFTAITVMFMSVLLGLVTYTIMTLQKDQSNALLIDMAGRQRMLLQKHINEVLLTSQGVSTDYSSTRTLMHSTLNALMNGGALIVNPEADEHQTIPSAPTKEIFNKLQEQQQHLDPLFQVADQLLLLAPDHLNFKHQLESLRRKNIQVIRIADEAVKQLDEYSEATISTMIIWEMIIAVFVGLLGVFVTTKGVRDGHKLEKEIEERRRAESALRDSEIFLNSIVENIPDMIFVKTAKDLRFFRVNKAFEELIPCSVKECLDKTDYDIFPSEQADFFTAKDREVLTGKKLVDISEEPIQTQSKGLRLLHTKKIPLLDEQGHPQYLLGISEDITERKEREKALQEWKTLTESILGQLPKGFAYRCLNDKHWTAVYVSNGIEEITGVPASALLSGKINYDSLMAPGENERVWSNVQEALGKHLPYENEHQIITSDGETKWILARGRFIYDNEGQLLYLDGLNVDITERKQIENALRASEARFRSLIEHVPFCIHEIDLDGTIDSMNHAGQRMIGVNNETQVLGRSHLELAEERDHKRIKENFMQATQGQPVDFEFNVTTHGNVRFFTKRFVPIRGNDGKTSKILGILEDITERKLAEERLRESEAKQIDALHQSDELKSALLSSVSHELRTPLTAMKTSVSSIIGDVPSEMNAVQKEFLEGIDQEINYMSRLVDNLLDMSQIEAGTLLPQREWHPLEDIVEGALRRTEQSFKTREIQIQIPEDLSPVLVDAVEIQQVFINILDNASKYSPSDSPIRLDVRVRLQQIEIEVSNTGEEPLGAEDLNRIFERFYRRPIAREQPIRGTGLGLAICKGIIEAHGGRIWAESTDKNVTITFSIPMTESMENFSLEGLHKR